MATKDDYQGDVGRPRSSSPLAAQFAFRTSGIARAAFLEWLDSENARRIVPMSEADALRVLVSWAGRTRPSIDELNRLPEGA